MELGFLYDTAVTVVSDKTMFAFKDSEYFWEFVIYGYCRNGQQIPQRKSCRLSRVMAVTKIPLALTVFPSSSMGRNAHRQTNCSFSGKKNFDQ